VLDSTETLSRLVCNAGLMAGPFRLSPQGFELQMATNHLGHAALVAGAVAAAARQRLPRSCSVSSLAARAAGLSPTTTVDELVAPSPYVAQRVYSNTKQANLLFALELSRRAGPRRLAGERGGGAPRVEQHRAVRPPPAGRPSLTARPVVKAVGSLVLQSSDAGALPTLRGLDHSTPSGAYRPVRAGIGHLRGPPRLLDLPFDCA
jgi:hypothetical protein